jgi:lipopolysaccharide transport system ATP-binding protein
MLFRGHKQFYREFWALKDVSFEIKKGETVGIIGRNGSGKSTLLKMICSTLHQTSGSIKTQGRIAALLELGSGFNPEFTGRENVFLYGIMLGLTREELNVKMASIEAFADIGDFMGQPVKTYSSGMVVRLAFSVIAHVDAEILVIDEALAVGDAVFTQKCMRFLREFKEKHTLLFVSHDSSAVTNLCERAIWLEAGKIKRAGKAVDVMQEYHSSNLAIIDADQGGLKQAEGPADFSAMDSEIDEINRRVGFNQLTHKGGTGQVKVISAAFSQGHSGYVNVLSGGGLVALRVIAETSTHLSSIIVGFTLKNRLGEVIMEDNTSRLTAFNPLAIQAGSRIKAEFKFRMPKLRDGQYTVDIAVADGTQENHQQHIWHYEALVINIKNNAKILGWLAPEELSYELGLL